MTDEELLERVRQIRHSRETIKPGTAKRVEQKEKKAAGKKKTGLDKMLAGLTPEQIQELIGQLGEPE
jgi:hypothetical protein